jgi:hypothetical protein
MASAISAGRSLIRCEILARVSTLPEGAPLSIELKHVPPWQLLNANRESGEVLRALAWSGRPHAREALVQLKPKLPSQVREELIQTDAQRANFFTDNRCDSQLGFAAFGVVTRAFISSAAVRCPTRLSVSSPK